MHPIPDIRPSDATNRRIPKTTPLSSRSSSIEAGSWVAYIEMGSEANRQKNSIDTQNKHSKIDSHRLT